MAQECSIDVETNPFDGRDIKLMKMLKEEENDQNCSSKIPPKVKTVPKMLGQDENYKQHYKPREVKLGPFGHQVDAPDDLVDVEPIKLKLARKFINSNGISAEFLLGEIKKNTHDLNTLFPHDSYSINDTDLARMMFIDGCTVLQFIFSYFEKELKDFDINNDQADVIRQDLFILGNQIPFQVLNLLFHLISDSDKAHRYRVYVFKFVLESNITELMDNYEAFSQPKDLARFYDRYKPVHLLGLLHSIFVYGSDLFFPSSGVSAAKSSADRRMPRIVDISYKRSFRTVQELKQAGIKVTPSDFNGLNSVHFASKFFVTGQLKFPPLIVDNSTEQKLLNLLAYEMTHDDYESYCWVVSYVNLLDLLIDSEQDVKCLRAARVLRNRLSNDAEVAQLFNKLGRSCYAPPRDEYAPVKNKLQRHYERKSAVWVAQVYHEHFRSPWTVLALLAALTALLLTGIQAWYAVHPKK